VTIVPGQIRALAQLAVLLVVTLPVTACSTGSDTAPAKLPAAATATAATPTPAPEAQVEAAVRNYFAIANAAIESGDTTILESLSQQGCECRAVIDEIGYIHANGRADDARFDLTNVQVREIAGATAAADIVYRVSAYQIVNASGVSVRQYPGGTGHDRISLVRKDERWLLSTSVSLQSDGGTGEK
jgi:hypothetical protein